MTSALWLELFYKGERVAHRSNEIAVVTELNAGEASDGGSGIAGGAQRFCIKYKKSGVRDDVFECFEGNERSNSKGASGKDVRSFVLASVRGLLQMY